VGKNAILLKDGDSLMFFKLLFSFSIEKVNIFGDLDYQRDFSK